MKRCHIHTFYTSWLIFQTDTLWFNALSKTITSDNFSSIDTGHKNEFLRCQPQFIANIFHGHIPLISSCPSIRSLHRPILSENTFSHSILILCIIFQRVNCTACDGMISFPIAISCVPFNCRISYHWGETLSWSARHRVYQHSPILNFFPPFELDTVREMWPLAFTGLRAI